MSRHGVPAPTQWFKLVAPGVVNAPHILFGYAPLPSGGVWITMRDTRTGATHEMPCSNPERAGQRTFQWASTHRLL